MDYRIADFILRTEGRHNDIAKCGLRGFTPFEVKEDRNIEPTMILKMDSKIDSSNYPVTRLIHSFDFEQKYAFGEFARYETGYRFLMRREDTEISASLFLPT